MLFSVLIANYNNSRFLETAMNSVINQTYTNWEIIVVDDGSTDSFEETISKYRMDARIKVFRNEKNYGCGYTKRKCAEMANGELMAYLDPDDALDRKALEIMVDAHRRMPDHSLIYSTHFICDSELSFKKIADYPKPLPINTPYLLLSDGSIHHFASFKRSAYSRTTGLSPKNKKAVDQDLYYKLEETGKTYFIYDPLYHYRIHEGSISTMGKEADATLWHYRVIEEACTRRINNLKSNTGPESRYWKKIYRTRFNKIKIFHSFRQRHWFNLVRYLIIFSFTGGLANLVKYAKKFPREGFALVRRSFVDNYQIKT